MTKNDCLIVQPIHTEALALLRAGGLEPRLAGSPAMDSVRQEATNAVAVATRNAGLSAAAMDAAPHLAVIGVHGVGVDTVDLEHATRLGIPVVNTPLANVDSVAEHTLMLLLAVAKATTAAHMAVRGGDFGFKFRASMTELAGKVLGIVGWGRIGRRFAAMAQAGLGMKVLVWSRSASEADLIAAGVERADSLNDLLHRADAVSLHLPATATTRGMIGSSELATMKHGAIFLNTSRGELVDEDALAAALRSGHLHGAGLDVFLEEPPRHSNPLLELPNVVLTPHAAGSTAEAQRRVALQMAGQMLDVVAGRKPAHLVNPEVWENRRIPDLQPVPNR